MKKFISLLKLLEAGDNNTGSNILVVLSKRGNDVDHSAMFILDMYKRGDNYFVKKFRFKYDMNQSYINSEIDKHISVNNGKLVRGDLDVTSIDFIKRNKELAGLLWPTESDDESGGKQLPLGGSIPDKGDYIPPEPVKVPVVELNKILSSILDISLLNN